VGLIGVRSEVQLLPGPSSAIGDPSTWLSPSFFDNAVSSVVSSQAKPPYELGASRSRDTCRFKCTTVGPEDGKGDVNRTAPGADTLIACRRACLRASTSNQCATYTPVDRFTVNPMGSPRGRAQSIHGVGLRASSASSSCRRSVSSGCAHSRIRRSVRFRSRVSAYSSLGFRLSVLLRGLDLREESSEARILSQRVEHRAPARTQEPWIV
jgi:hypothetical protein